MLPCFTVGSFVCLFVLDGGGVHVCAYRAWPGDSDYFLMAANKKETAHNM